MHGDLHSALVRWTEIIGEDNVITQSRPLAEVATATFLTDQVVPAVLRPRSREEVQECMRVATQYRTPIYAISMGKNWGYGSRVPVDSGSVLMDLSGLDQIRDYSETLGYVTVEPGVTFQQLYDFLEERGSNLFMAVTGSSPHSSLIGNIMERGIGKGPYAKRADHASDFEVVLPSGDCIQTGYSRFPRAKSGGLSRYSLGPFVDGLFTQSNLGIVTAMTIGLLPKPERASLFGFRIADDAQLAAAIDKLRVLKQQGLLRSSVVILNDFRLFSLAQQYPWDVEGAGPPMPEDVRNALRDKHGVGAWEGEGAIYACGEEHDLVQRFVIGSALENVVDGVGFVDDPQVVGKTVHLGVPSAGGLALAYWRKRQPPPRDGDPDRDRCGTIWCCPSVPFEGEQVLDGIRLIRETCVEYGFEPNLGIQCVSERTVEITSSIVFDRDDASQENKALAWHDETMARLVAAGYFPYRLSIRAMDRLPAASTGYGDFLGRIKSALDPAHVLAPGRYEI